MGQVDISLGNGALGGLIQTSDGITGLVMTGVSEAGGYVLGTPILLVNGMNDVTAAGISQANNPRAWKQLNDYFTEAGTPSKVYFMMVANTQTVALMATYSNANGCVKLLNYAAGAIKVLGLYSNDTVVYNGITTATLNAGGTGYVTGDTGTINNAVSGATLGTYHVTTAVGGAVTAFTVTLNGTGYSIANGVATTATTGAGVGLLVNITAITAPTVTGGINADVFTAATNMVTTAANYFAAETPFRCIIAGTSYSGVVANLTTMNVGTTNNRTAILIGDTIAGNGACLGLLLGLISTLPVQRKISRVENGPILSSTAYVGNTTVQAAGGDMGVIAGKGYITFITYPQTSGIFFSGDPMLTATTDDYCFLCRGRVIDKAQIITYTTFVQEVDGEIPLNTDGSGTMKAGFAATLQKAINDAIDENMTAFNNISGFSCFVDPAQNVAATDIVNIAETVTPVAYATDINVVLGFGL